MQFSTSNTGLISRDLAQLNLMNLVLELHFLPSSCWFLLGLTHSLAPAIAKWERNRRPPETQVLLVTSSSSVGYQEEWIYIVYMSLKKGKSISHRSFREMLLQPSD